MEQHEWLEVVFTRTVGSLGVAAIVLSLASGSIAAGVDPPRSRDAPSKTPPAERDGSDDISSSAAAGPKSAQISFRRCPTVAPNADPGVERVGARFDEPDAAIEHYWLKRQGPTPAHDPVDAYREALRLMDNMPRYSAAMSSFLPTRVEGFSSFVKSIFMSVLGRWTPLGPGNIGGRTRTLAIHPEHPEIMYCGGVSGGVWKTTDSGQSWTPITDRLANIAINSMAMDPGDPEVIYVGTGEGYFREIVRGTWLPLRGAGIYKTTDGGANWQLLDATDVPDFHWVNDLVVSTHDSDRVYAATRAGVLLSDDGGATWGLILDPQVNGGCLDLAVRTDLEIDTVFAACGTFEQATVYRRRMTVSGDWEAVLSEAAMGRTTLAIAPSDQRVVYALSASNQPGPGGHYEQALHAVYRSDDGGDSGSWRVQVDNADPDKLDTLILTNALGASYRECGVGDTNSWTPMGWYCNVIAVDPVNPEVVWAAGVDLFRSDDGGRSWGLASYWWWEDYSQPPPPSYAHADHHAIVFHPDYDGEANMAMFTATDGGVFRTDNPGAAIGRDESAICDTSRSSVVFDSLNHNLGITQFYHGAPFPGGEAYLGGTQDNGTLIGLESWGNDGWITVWGGDGGYVAIDPHNPNNLFVESQRFGLVRSTNGGYTFESAVEGVTEPRQNFLFITPFVMDPHNPYRLWTGGRRLWRTDNGADSWVAASEYPFGSGQASALAVAPGNSQLVVVGTTYRFVHRNLSALSADGSTTWESSRPREGFVSSLAFDPTTTDVIYATYAGFGGQHVWRSEDGGLSWEAIDGTGTLSLPDIPVHSIVVDPRDGDRLFLGTDLGVFTSTNAGLAWAVENTGFATAVTEWLTLGTGGQSSSWLFGFTHGRGAWKVELRPFSRQPSGRRAP